MKIKNYFSHLTGLELNVIKLCLFAMALTLITFCTCSLVSCTSCRNTANADTRQEKDALMALEYKNQLYGHMLRSYNHLLHRIWLDNPTYVEEVLTESDEFAQLDDLMGGEWEDTFQFYDAEDSITYHMNWDSTDGVTHVIKHVVIPEPTKSRLHEVFGDDY